MTTQYNVVTYGNLTNTNGVLSNFSASNYATIPLTFNPVQHPYEIVFKVNTGTMPTDANGTLWQTGDVLTSRGRLDLEIWHDRFYAELAANEDLVWSIDGITTVSSNTDYYAKLTYNGIDTYGLYLSTDGTTWTTEGTATSSAFLGDGTAEYNIIGVAPDNGGMIIPWLGSIDLNESYININGIRWWQGATSVSNVQTRIQLRHDTAANWASVNPILLEGEVGIETDTLKQKVGDGSTAWNSLAYAVNMSAKQDALVSGTNIKTINNTSLLGSGNIDTSQIFFAQYGTTTANQITQALGDGKAIFCIKSASSVDHIYYYSGTATLEGLSAFTFSRVYQNTTEVVYVSSITNQWNTITKTLANDDLSNVSSIDSGSAVQIALDSKTSLTEVLNALYPVGAIYIGTMSTCPIATLGVGTWTLKSSGMVLQGSDSSNTAGSTINASLPQLSALSNGDHSHNRGTMDIQGELSSMGSFLKGTGTASSSGALSFTSSSNNTTGHSSASGNSLTKINLKASSNWSGSTNTTGAHTHTVEWTGHVGTTVQPNAYVVNIWERTA